MGMSVVAERVMGCETASRVKAGLALNINIYLNISTCNWDK